MRTPDQDERPDSGTAADALGDGFGTVDQADLDDGYGTTDFYDDSYGYGDTVDPDDGYDDDTFDDAPDDDGGFGSVGDDSSLGEGDGVGEVVPVGNEVSDSEAENILEELLDDVFGDDADEVVDDMESSSGMDANEILDALGDGYGDDEALAGSDTSDGGVFDNPFDGPDGPVDAPEAADAADFVTESDFDLNTDGHVDHGDLREAAHPFDFHADGG